MDDPDQTAPAPRDDGGKTPRPPTPREKREMATGNQCAEAFAKTTKALDIEDLNASNDK